jgi:hypothetical protein
LQKGTMDKTKGLMLAVAPGSERRNACDDSVKTARCVKVHSQKRTPTSPARFPLQLFEEDWSHGISTGEAIELTRV